MTVAEFAALPDPPGAKLELRHGEPVPVTFPKADHTLLQRRLRQLLEPRLPDFVVDIELPFRPGEEHELWRADVGAVKPERLAAAAAAGTWLSDSPTIVVEAASRSNTIVEIDDRERTALGGGAEQFWVVYSAKQRYVRVAHRDGTVRRYGPGDEIPVGNGSIPVADIFSVLP
jgi:hypothetical protein